MFTKHITLALTLLLAITAPAWATSSPAATVEPLPPDSPPATAPAPSTQASTTGRQPKAPPAEWAQARTADGTALPLALDRVLGQMVAILQNCKVGEKVLAELGRRAQVGADNLHQSAGTATTRQERIDAIIAGGTPYLGRPTNCATVSNRLWFWAESLHFLAKSSRTDLMFTVLTLDVLSRDVAKAFDLSRTHPAHHDG